MLRQHLRSTLFPYTTLFRSQVTSLPPRPWPSTALFSNYAEAWQRAHMGRLLLNSAIVALGVAFGKIAISLLSAFAIVNFNFRDRKSTRLNSSHTVISYAVFC